jgi:hypothetical protein
MIPPVRARLAGGLVSVVALFVACFVPPEPASSTPAPSSPLAEVQRVLDARAAAVRSGDRASFLATIDPQASLDFRQSQATSFEGLRSLPLASFSLTARLDDTGDLGSGLSSRYGGDATFLPETRQRMRFSDYDDRDDVQSLYLTFVRRGGRWYVGGDRDVDVVGLDTFRGVWDRGPVRVQRTPHFLVLSDPEDAARAAVLADIAEEAMSRLDAAWTAPWSMKVPLIVPRSPEELASILQVPFDLGNFVAFVAYATVRERDWEPTAPRIYIQDRNLSRHGRDRQVHTLTHELHHAAVAPVVGPLLPAWLHEGMAEWVASGRPTHERRPGASDGRLPRDYEFTFGGAESITRSYGESRSVVSYLASRYGLDVPGRLLAALGAARSVPGSAAYRLDEALAQVAGLSFAQLEKGWAAS